jgi:glycosyltransferase involved in cell wall biosynthesis
MWNSARVAVVMPAYLEGRLIERALSVVPDYVDDVVVVDDGSPDDTSARAKAFAQRDPRVRVVRHVTNRGVGAALVTGYREAFAQGADVAVVMAGDGQMDPADLPALLAAVVERGAGYAKGNRLAWPGARELMPLQRFAGNHVLSALTRVATQIDVEDSQCGYSVMHRDAAAALDLDALWPRYGYPNDLLAQCAARGVRVVDVPVRPVYRDEVSGIGWRHALFVVPFVLSRSVARRLVDESVQASAWSAGAPRGALDTRTSLAPPP